MCRGGVFSRAIDRIDGIRPGIPGSVIGTDSHQVRS